MRSSYKVILASCTKTAQQKVPKSFQKLGFRTHITTMANGAVFYCLPSLIDQ